MRNVLRQSHTEACGYMAIGTPLNDSPVVLRVQFCLGVGTVSPLFVWSAWLA